ncbi:MAG TPA: NADH-quinone oxidoreductase subunit NuoH [Tepidisphaeraceae bacterium]|nr:NADH-quinone oxidoreductase subunit NuoH [Tepidisphaeraceae bacterium]
MPIALPFLACAAHENQPFVQRLIFDAAGIEPTLLARTLYGVALIAAVFLPFISVLAMMAIWCERRVAGRFQSRIGPNRVGPMGLFQSIADGIKLLLKEDLRPAEADGLLFRLAPYLAFVPVFVAFVALPFGPDLTFEPNLNAGVFWILAVLGIEVMGVILAGWASNNKWAVYGAMREACQIVSYEIPLGIAILVGVMTAGTLNMVALGHAQAGGIHTWVVFRNPFVFAAFFVYFVASLASNKRAPFDLPESESELVAGFHTEYSGMRFALFFFAEYAAMFVVGGIQAALFLGGWNDPFGLIGYFHAKYAAAGNTAGLLVVNAVAAGVFVAKAVGILLVQMWLRWTLPRPRIDQVLYACVKVLLPAACALLLGAALWQLLVPELATAAPPAGRPADANPWHALNPWKFSDWYARGAGAAYVIQLLLAAVGLTLAAATTAWVLYAAGFDPGRHLRQRLTDPAPIEMGPEAA